MRLKSLEMCGFKSFADKTTVEFGSGITAIVGPNGSGKSNISDAVKWVMGEQSAKSLRGGNMQDVIFSGTQSRKPLGFAEVTLNVDNSDRALNIEYDEVSVTRRVFRSGESEYFINKTAVRLKDIHELFMDTGVGRDGYSIIGQGKIAEILSSKPEERRQMFEEASGITKYRYRKEEAQRKLARTTENLIRLNDIITELENQVGPLKIQSEKAKKFLTLRDELRVIDVSVSLHNIEKHKKTLGEITGVYDALNAQTADVDKQAENAEAESASAFEQIAELDGKIAESRSQLDEFNTTRAAYQSDIAILKNRIENNSESIERIKREITELEHKTRELEGTGTDSAATDALYDSYETAEKQAAENAEQLNAVSEKISEASGELDNINGELIEKLNEASQLKYKISGNASVKSELAERTAVIETEISERETDYQRIKNGVAELEQRLAQKRDEAEGLAEQIGKSRQQYSKRSKEHDELSERLQQGRNNLYQAKSRLKLLADLESSFDNYSKSVKSIMNAHKKGEISSCKIYGTVAQLINVDKKYGTAVEIALGAAAQNIVTDSEEDAKSAIAFLKRGKLGRATFLPVSVCRGELMDDKPLRGQTGYIGIAAELVKTDARFSGIVRQLLGRSVIIDNIDNAVAIANKYGHRYRLVTLEGDLLSPGGSMTGGSRQSGSGIFSRANELAELTKRVPELERELAELEKRSVADKAELEQQLRAITDAEKQAQLLSDELITAASEAKHTSEFLKSVEEARTALTDEQKQLKLKLDSLYTFDKSGEEKISLLNSEAECLRAKAEAVKGKLAVLENEKQTASDRQIELRMELAAVKKDIERFNEIERLSNARKTENALAIERKKENVAEIKESISGLKDDIDFKNQQISELDDDILNLRDAIDVKDGERHTLQDRIKQLQEDIKQIHERQLVLQQEQGRLDSKKAKSESELENIVNRLWDDYELSLITAEQVKTELSSITEAQKLITALKNKIKSLGNINVDSIEEYAAVKERFDYLTSQRDDLNAAQKDLESVIVEMTAIMKEQFSDRFKEISGYFSVIFAELFGGGKGSIKLSDPSDVLECGIDIEVNPPGKAIKSVMQLSGGEQALVSIALLFAILRVRPAPFCILDEIEAALDDVNVYRFADFLNKNIGKTQYIVVTHRRGTMESANILYGVTMQEKGVTKMLSINIDEVVDAV